MKSKILTDGFDWIEAIVFAVVFMVVIHMFIFRGVVVNGSSMVPTLTNGNRLLISSMFYHPAKGDIVVITQPNALDKTLIKRIIATEGQTIDIDFTAGEVRVDGQLLNEPYIAEPTHYQFDVQFPVTVPEGCVFVMGDNRNNSTDSRSSQVGMIDTRYIMGKVVFRLTGKIGVVR